MNKKKIIDLYESKLARMREITNACETEKRARTHEEDLEWAALAQEVELCRMKLAAIDHPVADTRNTLANGDAVLREAMANRTDFKVVLCRDIMTTPALADTGLIPVAEKEMLDPLRAGLIWNKMGIPVQSGLSGTLRWPLHTKAVASWEGETSRLVDRNIDFRALTMQGQRLGLAIPVSKTELNDTSGVVERVVRAEMPAACADLINESMLTLVKEFYDMNTSALAEKTVAGPFAQKVSSNKLAGGCEVMTLTVNGEGEYTKIRKELLQMKAKVYGAGVQRKNPGFVINETTKALLEDTKVDAGSGRFVCENDQVLGVPVFTSNVIPDGVIGFGDWSYQAAGFFGETSMTIDPYTLARQHSTDFVLNMRFGTATLRKEAFVLGMTAAAQTALVNEIKALTPTD